MDGISERLKTIVWMNYKVNHKAEEILIKNAERVLTNEKRSAKLIVEEY